MSLPTVKVPFTYEGVLNYYTYKTSLYPWIPAPSFNHLEKPAFLPALLQDILSVASNRSITLPQCDFAWASYIPTLSDSDAVRLWIFREYVFSRILVFVSQLLSPAYTSEAAEFLRDGNRTLPKEFDITQNAFTTVGSSNLTSDIDVTIMGPYSTFLISILEDLFYRLTNQNGIPLRCWDIEFYGDYHVLDSLYINVAKFDTSARIKMLTFAYISYFRSTHDTTVSPLARQLGAIFLERLSSPLSVDLVIERALHEWNDTAKDGKLDRELFYKLSQKAEEIMTLLKPSLRTTRSKKVVSNNRRTFSQENHPYAVELFELFSLSNVHRAESYVLPSTAVHIVDLEQKSEVLDTDEIPTSWISSNVRVGVDAFAYIVSAIEQIGYLNHYHPSGTACNKKGIKYWGRLVRALKQASLLSSKYLSQSAEDLNAYRKSKEGVECVYNIHELIKQVEVNIGRHGSIKKGGSAKKTLRRLRSSRARATRRKG